jgi:hypothetical protein
LNSIPIYFWRPLPHDVPPSIYPPAISSATTRLTDSVDPVAPGGIGVLIDRIIVRSGRISAGILDLSVLVRSGWFKVPRAGPEGVYFWFWRPAGFGNRALVSGLGQRFGGLWRGLDSRSVDVGILDTLRRFLIQHSCFFKLGF